MRRRYGGIKEQAMRSYPRNSPQAAARLVALTVVADGDIGDAELACMDRLAVHEQLGLRREALHQLLDHFLEDLLSSDQLRWADACPVDERTLAALFADIDDPALRRKVLRLCVALAEVDAHVDEGESMVLCAAIEHWGLHRDMLGSPSDTTLRM
jgi:uncharacterized tellurite resistance protein B-like protein